MAIIAFPSASFHLHFQSEISPRSCYAWLKWKCWLINNSKIQQSAMNHNLYDDAHIYDDDAHVHYEKINHDV